MASSWVCLFCGATVTSDEEKCRCCGASNPNYIPAEDLIVSDSPKSENPAASDPQKNEDVKISHPKTIEELKTYCAQQEMPLPRMRFFIGENYQGAKAFGIYQDGDQFVVYKNKSDGSRSVRYHGPDEAYAVNELFQKLLSECHNRGIYPDGKPSGTSGNSGNYRVRYPDDRPSGTLRTRIDSWLGNKNSEKKLFVFLAIACILLVLAVEIFAGKNRNGYYRTSNNEIFYRYSARWYVQTLTDWVLTNDFPEEDYEQYYVGNTFDSGWGGESFQSSDTYRIILQEEKDRRERERREKTSSSDYDSWDSDDTDWDSDW